MAGVTVFTRLNNPEEIRFVAKPESMLGNSEWTDLAKYRALRQERLASAPKPDAEGDRRPARLRGHAPG